MMTDFKEAEKVLRGFNEGKTIEIFVDGGWRETTKPAFNFGIEKYRVKPESIMSPYSGAKEFLAAQSIHGPYLTVEEEEYVLPVYVRETLVGLQTIDGISKISYGSLTSVYGYYWQDGTPCGVVTQKPEE